jgi:hypothetical protein
LSTLLASTAGCGEIKQAEGQSCSTGTDCIYPAVCCTNPRIPAIDDPIPLCENLRYCDAWMPVLHAGNPCEPAPAASSDTPLNPNTQCAEPWLCCPNTRRCATAEDCAAAPAPAPAVSSGEACHSPDDCGADQYCAGLTINSREGVCRAFVEGEAPADAGL